MSRSFIRARSAERQSVTIRVNQMYSATIATVAATSGQPNVPRKMLSTSTSSSTVGAMLKRRKYSIVSMLLVPRSTTLVTAPVRRDRWKSRLSAWRWRNTCALRRRVASCPTRSNTALRRLSNRVVPNRAAA